MHKVSYAFKILTPIIESYVVRCGSMSGHPKQTCVYKKLDYNLKPRSPF